MTSSRSPDVACRLAQARAAARDRAARALESRGFVPDDDGWVGTILTKTLGPAAVRVVLSDSFPDTLPKLTLEGHTERLVPHVDRAGTVCIASHETLLDAERPDEIVLESIALAAKVIDSDPDEALEEEFVAYWRDDALPCRFTNLLDPAADSGEIICAIWERSPRTAVLAASLAEAESFARRCGWTGSKRSTLPAFHWRLSQIPNPRGDSWRLGDLLSVLKRDGDTTALQKWLRNAGVPSLLVFSAPLAATGGHAIFAVHLPPLPAAKRKLGQKGSFGKQVSPRVFELAKSEPVTRFAPSRLDRDYLLPRGGGALGLATKSICIVGCGAVGSEIGSLVAAAGVGRIVLIDPDIFEAENVHRHVLGASDLGRPKVEALASNLESRFPGLRIDARPEDVLTVLAKAPDTLVRTDLVLVALGDETVERRMNRLLWASTHRVHAWVEPYGLGGHALFAAAGEEGCFECLFRPDDDLGLINMASLTAPGQRFAKSLGGCSGTFVPFGRADAVEAALHAARLAANVLGGRLNGSVLLSWLSDRLAFEDAGFTLSARGRGLHEGCTTRERKFRRPECSVCAPKA